MKYEITSVLCERYLMIYLTESREKEAKIVEGEGTKERTFFKIVEKADRLKRYVFTMIVLYCATIQFNFCVFLIKTIRLQNLLVIQLACFF